MRQLRPSWSHLVYTLIGLGWPVYGVIFLTLLCSTDWFAVNIAQMAPLAVLFSLIVGHCLASCLESNLTTKAVTFFKHGLPLIYYRRFARVLEPVVEASEAGHEFGTAAIVFGRKRVAFAAIDELFLTLLGTLEIRSYASAGHVFDAPLQIDPNGLESGHESANLLNQADVLVRIPLSILALEQQREFVALFQSHNPHVKINKRLTERLNSPIVKGQNLIQSLGAALLVFALCDVTFATFTWLEMLKGYYGAQLCLRHPAEAQVFHPGSDARGRAEQLYNQSENLRLHPAPFSWAYRALFANANSQAQLLAIKAETLYRLGRKDDAIAELEQALTAKTTGFKAKIQLVRYLAESGQTAKARQILDQILEKHKDVLLPRIYREALLAADSSALRPAYEKDLKDLDDETFGSEPAWPPGGEKAVMEMWKRDDLTFLAEHILFRH